MGIFDLNKTAKELDESKQYVTSETKLYKYYLEVIGGQKELYTVKANDMIIGNNGCYVFVLDDNAIAMYPIERTIVKSIEEKTNE